MTKKYSATDKAVVKAIYSLNSNSRSIRHNKMLVKNILM